MSIDNDTRKLLMWFVGIAVTALVVVLGLYCYAFAPDSWFTLSRDSEQWARFGEYVGGTLGSAFGLLAFGGVLFTIREQRRQSHIEEFQRQMSSLSARVETLLSEEPAESGSEIQAQIEKLGVALSVFSLLATVGNQAIAGPNKDYIVQATTEKRRDLILPTIKRQLAVVQIELQHLVWCIERYLEMGGDKALTKLYRRKYEPVICWMHVVGLVDSETLVGFFEPEAFCVALREAPGEIEPLPIQS
jgi:hypothetical protein